jgi:hypothetical protein
MASRIDAYKESRGVHVVFKSIQEDVNPEDLIRPRFVILLADAALPRLVVDVGHERGVRLREWLRGQRERSLSRVLGAETCGICSCLPELTNLDSATGRRFQGVVKNMRRAVADGGGGWDRPTAP